LGVVFEIANAGVARMAKESANATATTGFFRAAGVIVVYAE
jgi:hypothetical protein